MKSIAETILNHLDTCPISCSSSKWRYAYELVLGAGASLIRAEKYFVGTSQYDSKQPYDCLLNDLHRLLRQAYQEADEKPIDLYYDGLEIWTAGYYFNSGVVRIGCAYECTTHTTREREAPYASLNYNEEISRLMNGNPSPEVEKQLQVFRCLHRLGRTQLDQQVDALTLGLWGRNGPPEAEKTEEVHQRLITYDDEFLKTAFYFVCCDYNWFKHRPIGYQMTKHPRKDHRFQLALAVRAFCALCTYNSWCYRNPMPVVFGQ
jgi:hypothetical protein